MREEWSLLFDVYGELLPPGQREAFRLHYEEDLSWTEVGQSLGTTRQAAQDAASRAGARLRRLESVVGAIEQDLAHRRALASMLKLLAGPQGPQRVRDEIRRLLGEDAHV